MRTTRLSSTGPASAKRLPPGFALVVTLSLMILLTVIAVGLLTLSSISLRAAGQGDAMAKARANARVALMLAIGNLQKNAGPDQRITARADVINATIANPRLTGVWNSWEIKPTAQPSDYERTARDAKFRGWLVSGDPVESAKIDFAGLAPLSTSATAKSPPAVTLWDKGTLGSPPAPAAVVTATKVALTSSPGALAWAVMDEGVKVRIDTPYSDTATTQALKTAQLGAGERPGVEFISGLNGLDRRFFEKSATQSLILANGITRSNFSLAGEQLAGKSIPPALKTLTHDVTTVSNGLFTDAARGGLKQDFQLLANLPTLPTEYLSRGVYASRSVMPSSGGPSDPRWESLQQFASLYKDTVNLTNFGNVPLLKTKAPAAWNSSTQSGTTTTLNRLPPPGVVLMPTIAKVQILFSLIARDIYRNLPTGEIKRLLTDVEKVNMHGPHDDWFRNTKYNFDLHLLYTPVVTLHNPYNVAIEFNDMRLEFIGVPFAMQVFRNDLALSSGLVPFESMTIDNQDSQNSKAFGMNLRTKVAGNVGVNVFRMLPGEVIMFSPYINPARTYAQDLADRKFWDIYLSSGLTRNIDAIPGWRGFGIGFDCDWLAGNQPAVGNSSGANPATALPPYGLWRSCYGLAWDDQIHVQFAPLSIPVNNNKFVIQMSAKVDGVAGKKVASIEMDYERRTGLQEFLSPTGGLTTMRYPKESSSKKYVLGHELRKSSNTPISEITNAEPFALLTAQAKTTSGGRDVTHKEGRFSGKPWAFAHGSVGSSSQKIFGEHPANHSHELDLLQIDKNDAIGLVSVDDEDRSYFITGHTSNLNAAKFGTLYDIPLTAIQTLASLNGANPGGSSGYLPRFAQPIGNSWAHPLISPNNISQAGPSGYNYLDHSFLLNLALYDGFYFSGFADQSGSYGTAGRTSKVVAEEFAKGTPLGDPRIVLRLPSGKVAADLGTAVTQLTAYKDIAAWQSMNGAFNINSTSVPAWKAMLASVHDAQSLVNRRASERDIVTSLVTLKPTATNKARISRLRLPASTSSADGALPAAGYWLGPREYSDAELETLATKIVEHVRLRGPFLSMAEFVNRRLGTNEMAQRGTLQQAVDDSNLNSSFAAAADAGYDIPSGSTGNYKYVNNKAGEGESYQGAPGYLTQADILNVLGNAATVRSDTFTIRAYGESRDASGNITASVTCEAVIQRAPDWIDSVDAVETPIATLSSNANRIFGRRFLVTSFRWLNPSEI